MKEIRDARANFDRRSNRSDEFPDICLNRSPTRPDLRQVIDKSRVTAATGGIRAAGFVLIFYLFSN